MSKESSLEIETAILYRYNKISWQLKQYMDKKQERLDKAYIWVNIDFDKVQHRINAVTYKIEWVIQKHQLSNQTGKSGKRNN